MARGSVTVLRMQAVLRNTLQLLAILSTCAHNRRCPLNQAASSSPGRQILKKPAKQDKAGADLRLSHGLKLEAVLVAVLLRELLSCRQTLLVPPGGAAISCSQGCAEVYAPGRPH